MKLRLVAGCVLATSISASVVQGGIGVILVPYTVSDVLDDGRIALSEAKDYPANGGPDTILAPLWGVEPDVSYLRNLVLGKTIYCFEGARNPNDVSGGQNGLFTCFLDTPRTADDDASRRFDIGFLLVSSGHGTEKCDQTEGYYQSC